MHRSLKVLVAFVFLVFSNLALAIPININYASADEIAQSLKGIGVMKATKIVNYRKNGLFKRAGDIARVKVIGVVIIKKSKELILIK